MNTVLAYLKTWFVTNWKTTILGVIAAVELYQHTHNIGAALTAFFTGLFMSDAKTPAQAASQVNAAPPGA